MKHDDGGMAFQLERSSFNCLQLRFTGVDNTLMNPTDIRKELTTLTRLFKQAITSLGIVPDQCKVEPNWTKWTLTITAEPATLNKIGGILHKAGATYFQSAPQARTVLFRPIPSMPPSAAGAVAEAKEPPPSIVTCALQ
jgi:hypothetical protein